MDETYRSEVLWLQRLGRFGYQDNMCSIYVLKGTTMVNIDALEGVEHILFDDWPALFDEIICKSVWPWRLVVG